MAGEMPPPMPPAGEFSAEDYEFEDFDELEPGNAVLDEVLTRAGEFALDTIEAIQAHPVVAASLVAAGFGALAGLVAAKVAPRRRPSLTERTAAAATDSAARVGGMLAAAGLGARLADAQGAVGGGVHRARGRVEHAAEAAGERVRGASLLDHLTSFGGRARERATTTAEDLADAARRDGGHGLGDAVADKARRASYAGQLLPLGLALLRNPLVRDLLAQMLASRLRRTARL